MQCLNFLTVPYDRLAEWGWQKRFAACTQAFDHLSQGILILMVQQIGTEDEPLKGTTYRKDRKQIFIVKCYR